MRSRVSQLCAASVSLVVFGVLITTLPGSRALTNRRHNQAAPVSSNLPDHTDLLTLYADMLVAHQGQLPHAGDHFYFERGTPASWADGNYVLIGEDSVDFEVTLTDINLSDQIVTLVVRHVPPAKPEVKTVADC